MLRHRVAYWRRGRPCSLAGGDRVRKLAPLLTRTRSPFPGRTRSVCATCSSSDFGDRPDGSFRSSSRCPTRATRRSSRGCRPSSTRAARELRTGAPDAAPRRPAADVALRRRRLDARLLGQAKGVHERRSSGGRAARRRRARVRHGRGGDPARPRPDLQRGPGKGRVDRAPDRARSCCCRVRPLVAGARSRSSSRPARSSSRSGSSTDRRTSPRTPTYVTNLVQLIGLGIAVDYSLLDRLPLPRGARARADRRTRRGRAHDGDGGPRGRLLGRDGRARARASARSMPLPFMRMIGRRRAS